MKWFRDLSIRHKFFLIILFTSGASLLFTSAAVIIYDTDSYKQTMVDELAAHADIIAHNSASALAFDDRDSADETLAALRATGNVMAAYVLGEDGEIFGRYIRDERTPVAQSPLIDDDGHQFFADRLVLRRPIVLEGELLGSVYIEGDLNGLSDRFRRYVGMAVSVVAGAMILVLLLSSRLQRSLSGPILRLAETAKTISRRKNYSVRAEKTSDDEIGTLIDGFNEMLDQIQARDAKLEQHRDELENEVTLRTGELRHVNARLKESEARIRAIVEGTSSTTGSEFFDALTMTLARTLEVKWVMVGLLHTDGNIEARALWDGERIQRNLLYRLMGTPCERAARESFAVYEDRVGDQFPDAEQLHALGVRSYVGVLLKDSSGTPIGVLSAFHDQPMPELARHGSLLRVFASRAAAELERMLVEEELQKSESRTRAILDSAADAIITFNDKGKVETHNIAAEQIFLRPHEGFSDAAIADLMRLPGDDSRNAAFKSDPVSVLAPFIGQRGEIEGLRSDGTSFPMNVVLSRMEVGGDTSYTAILRDITRERELEQMKSDFVSTVSHEIRTPLSCIISSAKILLKNGDKKPGVTEKFSGIIAEEGKRLSRLINDLLDLSKMDTGGLEWTFKEADPREILGQVVTLNQADARVHELALSATVDDDVAAIQVDRDKVIQVLNHLVSNAIKFTEHGGKIDLFARQNGDGMIVMGVADTGVGIAPEHREVIFERFKQIGDVLTDRPQGTGLGLTICKEIVEYLGGHIWVESEVGQGSRFMFTVPAAVSEDELKDRLAPGSTVLVVDDEASTRDMIAYLLEHNGFNVIVADSGEAALSKARSERPDLITLDIMMPDLSGYDVLEALRGDPDLKDTPVLLMSVLSDPAHSERGLRLGASAYLSKPVEEATLVSMARRLLGKCGKLVLVVASDAGERETMRANLTLQGYVVMEEPNVDKAVARAKVVQPDLVILGASNDKLANAKLLKTLREDDPMASIPILLVTDYPLHGVNAAYLDSATSKESTARGSVSDLLASFVDNRDVIDRSGADQDGVDQRGRA